METNKTVLDDGTILIPASESGRVMFQNTTPRIDKLLKSDGSVVSDDGTILFPASESGRVLFQNTTPRIGKVLKPDGSVIESTSGIGEGTPGPQGPQGLQGPQGFGVSIRVYSNTEYEYVLVVINEGGETFLTPNLKGTAHIGFY